MKSIYLDQNVFGHLFDNGDWKTPAWLRHR